MMAAVTHRSAASPRLGHCGANSSRQVDGPPNPLQKARLSTTGALATSRTPDRDTGRWRHRHRGSARRGWRVVAELEYLGRDVDVELAMRVVDQESFEVAAALHEIVRVGAAQLAGGVEPVAVRSRRRALEIGRGIRAGARGVALLGRRAIPLRKKECGSPAGLRIGDDDVRRRHAIGSGCQAAEAGLAYVGGPSAGRVTLGVLRGEWRLSATSCRPSGIE